MQNAFNLLISSLFYFSFLAPANLLSQTVELTFQVDMSQEMVSPLGVHLAGNFQEVAGLGDDWTPGSTQIFDADGDDVYSITVSVPPGSYAFKFINGNAWGMDENPPAECSEGNTNNRVVSVGNTDLILPVVPFNGCPGSTLFSVNLSGIEVSEAGIHVIGDFQETAGYGSNWEADVISLSDLNGDGTYEIRLIIPPGNYRYLFVNGNTLLEAEEVPLACSITGTNGLQQRELTVSSGQSAPPTYCFGSCDVCDPGLVNDYATYWWNDAVFYEMFVRSFYDSDGDGIGDFRGAIEKLDYLNDGDPETDTDLGVTAIWLMPMLESPSYHGYDVTNYYTVEPDYGTMEDFEDFLEAAHARGIKVIIDLVLNHTSNQHPWFIQSAANNNDFRDWYVWEANNPGFPGPWGQGVWHPSAGNYYYGLFWGGMPDLNFTHPPVREEIFNITNFWLDMGVDGYRLDAIKYLVEDGTILENTPETFALLEAFNDVYKSNNPEAFTVGEVWSNTASIIPYVQNDRLDVCFDFDLAGDILGAVNSGNPTGIRQQMQVIQAAYPVLQYATFLTNHDIDRVYNQIGSDADKMKLAASLYLSLPGIPFLYYGEEISMRGTGAHENIRRPMQWSSEANAGFSTATPWNTLGADYSTNNVVSQEAEQASVLNHYKRLIHLRNQSTALRRGNYFEVSNTTSSLMSFARILENEAVIVAANLSTQAIASQLSLETSPLAPGTYYLTDLLSNQSQGTVLIGSNGGFSGWEPATLGPRSTGIYGLSPDNPVSTVNPAGTTPIFELAPNPSSGIVRLSLSGLSKAAGTVNVIGTDGRLVYTTNFSGEQLNIDTTRWPSGVYFVRVAVNGQQQTRKLVVR
jgi:glycosidase